MNDFVGRESAGGAATQPDSGKTLVDYLAIIYNHWRFIGLNVAAVTLTAVVVSLFLPKWYRSTASILPPKEPDLIGSVSMANSVFKSLAGGGRLGGLKESMGLYNYLAILKSRSAMEAVVTKFDLREAYQDSSMEESVKELRNNVFFELQEDDYLTIEVLDRDPLRAAAMANHFVALLNELSIRLATEEARNNREFIEARLLECERNLKGAEDHLKQYQERTGVMLVPDQNGNGMSAVAELYLMKEKKEIEVGILERRFSENSEFVQGAKVELDELNRKLGTIPSAGLESYRLFRDVAVQQKILEFLVPAFEQSKLEEQKNVPVLLVLDRAGVPEKKDRPKRTMIVLIAAAAALFLNLAFFLVRDTLLQNEALRRFVRTRIRKQ